MAYKYSEYVIYGHYEHINQCTKIIVLCISQWIHNYILNGCLTYLMAIKIMVPNFSKFNSH